MARGRRGNKRVSNLGLETATFRIAELDSTILLHYCEASMRQLSLTQCFLAVAVAGLFIASLRYATPWRARILFDSVLVLLAVAVLFAVYSREPKRAFWIGFTLFGWIMVPVTQFNVLLPEGMPAHGMSFPKCEFHPLAKDNLPTTIAARGLYRTLRPVLVLPTPAPPPSGWLTWSGQRTSAPDPNNNSWIQSSDGTIDTSGPGPFFIVEDDFVNVAESWWILLSGVVGGLTARWLSYRQNHQMAASA